MSISLAGHWVSFSLRLRHKRFQSLLHLYYLWLESLEAGVRRPILNRAERGTVAPHQRLVVGRGRGSEQVVRVHVVCLGKEPGETVLIGSARSSAQSVNFHPRPSAPISH